MKKILIAVLSVLVIGLGGYLIYDKVFPDDTKVVYKENSNKNEEKEEIKVISVEEAEELISKYHTGVEFNSQYNNGFTTARKQYLAWLETKNKVKKNSSELFELEKEEEYGLMIKGEEFLCTKEQTETVSYDEINKTYKSMFGSDVDIPKEKFAHLLNYYLYSEKSNSFGLTYVCAAGLGPNDIQGYTVKDVEVEDNQLIINVAYLELTFNLNLETDEEYYSYYINDTEKTVTLDNNDELAVKTLAKKHVNDLPVYQYVFEKDNGNYVLVDFKQDLFH